MNKAKEFTWESSEDAELWMHGVFNSIDDCIADAVENYGYVPGDTIYIGEPVEYIISVDAESVLDDLEEQAREFAGEAAEGWNAYDIKDKKGLEKLSEKLTEVVQNWLKEKSMEPDFYQVVNIAEIEIK